VVHEPPANQPSRARGIYQLDDRAAGCEQAGSGADRFRQHSSGRAQRGMASEIRHCREQDQGGRRVLSNDRGYRLSPETAGKRHFRVRRGLQTADKAGEIDGRQFGFRNGGDEVHHLRASSDRIARAHHGISRPPYPECAPTESVDPDMSTVSVSVADRPTRLVQVFRLLFGGRRLRFTGVARHTSITTHIEEPTNRGDNAYEPAN
jgi:hypothetical protein